MYNILENLTLSIPKNTVLPVTKAESVPLPDARTTAIINAFFLPYLSEITPRTKDPISIPTMYRALKMARRPWRSQVKPRADIWRLCRFEIN